MKIENTRTNNPELDLAWKFLEQTGTHVFLTGRAGTGKTSFLHDLKAHSPKRMIVLAPTGVAAINAGGVTIHSFFQLAFGPYLPDLQKKEGARMKMFFNKEKIAIIKSLDLLVIDEISMLRADLLDAIDEILKKYRGGKKAFGGVQLLMIGDLQQLPPVVKAQEWELLREHYASPYFFDSKALRSTDYIRLELKHIYRQSDQAFIDILNKVRDKTLDFAALKKLNSRYIENFEADDKDAYITLSSHNEAARRINEKKMQAIASPSYTYTCEVEGNFPEYLYPNEKDLCLKAGAQVMFLKNDTSGLQRYYNGKIGRVSYLDQDTIEVLLEEDEETVKVEIGEWSNAKYSINPSTHEIQETIEGVFRQYPLKLAWAITIHKSQGLSFDRAIIDAADSFSHGQVYVALSRCRSFDGLVLRTPLPESAIIQDAEVIAYSEQMKNISPDEQLLSVQSRLYTQSLLSELFQFLSIKIRLRIIRKIYIEHLNKLYPKLSQEWDTLIQRFEEEVFWVSEKFLQYIERAFLEELDLKDPQSLKDRIRKARAYFKTKCEEIILPILPKSVPSMDNKEMNKQIFDAMEKLNEVLFVKLAVLQADEADDFSISSYLQAKAKASLNIPSIKKIKKENADFSPHKILSGDIQNPELFEILKTWRKNMAQNKEVPVYVILKQIPLIQIANQLPRNNKDLLNIKGIGKVFVSRYGEEIISIVQNFDKNTF